MAQNDIIVFDKFRLDKGNGVHNLSSDTIKFGLVDNTHAANMVRDESDPRWGASGSVDFSGDEISSAVSYTGPVTLANTAFTESADVFTFDADDPAVIAQDATQADDAYWMVIYNDTASNKQCICAIDLGGPIALSAGTLTIQFHLDGIFTIEDA